jgi:hypothetical protein
MSLRPRSKTLTVVSLSLLLAIGVCLVGMGTLVVPALPYRQLDVVVTADERADESKRAAALEMLKRANGNAWLYWTIAGVGVIGLSAMGLWSERGMNNDAHVSHPHHPPV